MNVASQDSDPHVYLEDGNDPRTIAWTVSQNARTRAALDAVPGRAALVARLDELLRTDVESVPVVRDTRAFSSVRRGDANQASLVVREGGHERTLVDPAVIDAAGLTTIDWWYPSRTGNLVAFGLSQNGDERSTLHIVDVATGARLADTIPDTRYASVAWSADDTEFAYTRYPPGGQYGARVYRHVVGTGVPSDREIFGAGRKPEDMLDVQRSPGGRYLVVTAREGWSRSDVYVADTTVEPLRFEALVEGSVALYNVDVEDEMLYVHTNEDAPRFRAFAVDPASLARATWREIVPQRDATLESLAVSGETLALHYLENARSVLRVRYPDASVVEVPETGGRSVLAMTIDGAAGEAYVQVAGYVEAPEILRIGLNARPPSVASWQRIATPFDATAYRVEQRWYVSKDGTRVPLSIVARRDVAFDGSAPAVLYGYGGFSISLVPAYAASLVPWLDAGGIYVVANLRGGGEFGETWHRDGMRDRKQNTFDDFIAAAEFLGSSGLADPARIAVMGGSNGGLLVSAFATQRPDLARAVVCLVPLTDMLRFDKFLIARLWIAEYGDPGDATDAAILRAYSPYHNVRDGVAYPAMLVATAESDSRVDPMHARKFGARVAEATSSEAPIYVYVEANAGHGIGKPRHKVVAELADRWSFLATQLGVALGA